jgi:hypothetical protein
VQLLAAIEHVEQLPVQTSQVNEVKLAKVPAGHWEAFTQLEFVR